MRMTQVDLHCGHTRGKDWRVILNVPLIQQEENTYVCVLAALSMILQYHGRDVSIADLECDEDAKGTDMGDIGVYLLKNGFDAEVVMFHPRLFTVRDFGMSQDALVERFGQAIGREEAMWGDHNVLRALLRFMEHGGRVTVKIPDEADIRGEIAAGRPLLATTDTQFLYGMEPGRYLHANVIEGIDDTSIYVTDSLWDQRGGRHAYGKTEYLYGIHTSTHGNFNNGSLLKVMPASE